jgi:molybdate transport system substrate-binding protein
VALLALLALVAGCRPGGGDRENAPIVVFAAASTGDVLTDLVRRFEASSGARVSLNLAGSALLARQLEAGARADLYLGADPRWTRRLEERDVLATGSSRDLLANALVIVVHRDRAAAIPDLDLEEPPALAGGVAIADPQLAPAGRYTRQALGALGWLDRPGLRLIPAADVRAALRLVELGEVDAGVVYATDAAASRQVTVAARIDPALHEPIRYSIALTRDARPAARELLEYVLGPDGRGAFAAAGFTVVDPAAR